MLRALIIIMCLLPMPLLAAESAPVEGNAVTARLITAEDGVGTGVGRLTAGLDLDLKDGWKTYWRSPGEVGLPPDLHWDGSENIAAVDVSFPAPTRFEAFDIQNFGYGEEVVYPLAITLVEPGAPARLDLTANLLVCAEVCIPETVELSLELPAGGGVDSVAAARLAEWIARVPVDGPEAGISLEDVHLDDQALTLVARSSEPFKGPDIFPELGEFAAFGKPEIVLSDDGRSLWARLPVLSKDEGVLDLTIADGARAATLRADPGEIAPERPTGGAGLLAMVLVAMLGGLILNVMPCVLPVLSIKLASALQAADKSAARVRAGFLASAAGVLTFFGALAVGTIALQSAGVAVGWGVQFQNPAFLALMIGLMTLFAANMFGFFSVNLGQGAMTGLARTEARGGWGGDFATGAFAAVMATPCSAPFIGTAVTYALTSGSKEVVAIFLAMGFGLALPYILVAARPGLVQRLPRPGRWMASLQRVMAVLLLAAVVWLLTVLAASAGLQMALVVGLLAVSMLGAFALRRMPKLVGAGGLAAVVLAAFLVPAGPVGPASADAGWEVFVRERIADEVAAGHVVFVDVTADWCLTCKANKRLVLARGDVAMRLAETVAMQADWTRPDPEIAAYLKEKGRFGIPFNAVYGPGAPDGVLLPELLTESIVLDAIRAAEG